VILRPLEQSTSATCGVRDADVAHGATKFGQHAALEISEAWVFGREIDGDSQRLANPR